MEINYIQHIKFLLLLFTCGSAAEFNASIFNICPFYKKGLDVNVQDLVGSWMTVYTQPKAVDCFIFHVRATTDLEREQYVMKYGNFNGRVDWNSCLLQVETPQRRHYLQGNGTNSGLLENIIVIDNNGEYALQNQSADQWMVFGRRGGEVLVIRDCSGETTAALARAPYWPSVLELNAIFHRSGLPPLAPARMLCEPSGLLQRNTRPPHITSTIDVKRKYKDILQSWAINQESGRTG